MGGLWGILQISPTVWAGMGVVMGGEEGHTHTDRKLHRNTQETTRECCTYP